MALSQRQVDDFMKLVPDRVVTVFDEAYRGYVEDGGYADVRKYIEEGRNVIVVRTFSKIYGLAGLRVGYGVAKKETIEYLLRALSAYHVGALNLVGAVASLDNEEHVLRRRKQNTEQRRYLYQKFDRLDIQYLPTQCNFILLMELGRDIEQLWEVMARRGVVVTKAAAFGVPDAILVTIGTREDNERFGEALEQVLGELPEQ